MSVPGGGPKVCFRAFLYTLKSLFPIFSDTLRVAPGVRIQGVSARIARFRSDSRSGNNLNFMRRIHKILLGILIGSTAHAADPPDHFYTPSGDSVLVLRISSTPDKSDGFPGTGKGERAGDRKKTKKKEDLYYTIQAENGDHFLRPKPSVRPRMRDAPQKSTSCLEEAQVAVAGAQPPGGR